MAIVQVMRVGHGLELPLPAYETRGSAGMDLRAAIGAREVATLQPTARAIVPTGLAIALPENFEAQVRPRSGLAAKFGLTVLNTPGTIDSDYRGEIAVILLNMGADPFRIEHGMRIAQLVIAPVTQATWDEVKALDETNRSGGGFGSTGQ